MITRDPARESATRDIEDESEPSPARPVLRNVLWAVAAGVLAMVIAGIEVRLWDANLRVPLAVHGDSSAALALIDAIGNHGWWWTDPSLGAPSGAQRYDYAASFTDTGNLLIVKAILLIVNDPGFALNAYFIGTFGAAAFTALLVLRAFRVSFAVALVGAVLFAILPFHFLRGVDHAWLSGYWSVPVGIWLVMGAAGHVRIWRARAGVDGWKRYLSWSSALLVLAILVVAGTGVYFALFTAALLLGVVGFQLVRDRHWRPILVSLGLALALLVAVALMSLPSVVYQLIHGSNEIAAGRRPIESEVYGLKLTDLLFSRSGDNLPSFLTGFGREYGADTPIVSEGGSPWLGALLAFSFVFGILYGVIRGVAAPLGRRAALVRDSGLLMAWAFVIATVGGLSTPFAYLISAQIRGYNRISVVIAFLAVIVFAVLLERAAEIARSRSFRHGGLAAGAVIALVGVFGVWNQTSGTTSPDYATATTEWRNRAAVVSAVDHNLPQDAMILQLPYAPYPEHGPVERMPDYAQLLPYVQSHRSDLRWSAGALKGRPDDWMALTYGLSTAEVVTSATAAGFDAIWLDRHGYADEGVAITAELETLLGTAPMVMSDDGRFLVFRLDGFAERLADVTDEAQRERAAAPILHPVEATWTGVDETASGQQEWVRTGGPEITVTLDAPAETRGTFVVRAQLVAPGPTPVTVTLPDGRTRNLDVTPKSVPFEARIELGDDPATIRFTARGTAEFAVRNFSLTSTATAGLLRKLER